MSYRPDIPPQIKKSKFCPAVPAARNNEAFNSPHVAAQRAPDATEAQVQFSKVTMLSASWEKLPSV